MDVVCMYVYIHYHSDECGRKKRGLERAIFWNGGSIIYPYQLPLHYKYVNQTTPYSCVCSHKQNRQRWMNKALHLEGESRLCRTVGCGKT